jgi:hypothetical protein
MGYDTLGISEGGNSSPARVDGITHQLCAHWELAHEEPTRQNEDLSFSNTDHATRQRLSN